MNPPKEFQRTLRELPPRRPDWYTQAVMLLGDVTSQTGWAMLAIGSFFFWTTAVNSEVRYFFEKQTINWQQKAGVVLEADSTQGVESKNRIWKYRHSFALDDYRYLGTSFSVGKKFDAGQIAYIRYDPANPVNNYITGLRRSEFSWRVNLLLLIPAFGLLLILLPVRKNLKELRLLKIGDFTRGVLENKTATGQTVREGAQVLPVFQYQFRFEFKDTIYFATCRTHRTAKVEDEISESILFDRFDPAFNLVYDAVPNVPPIHTSGKLARMSASKAWVLFLPVFSLLLNLIFSLSR